MRRLCPHPHHSSRNVGQFVLVAQDLDKFSRPAGQRPAVDQVAQTEDMWFYLQELRRYDDPQVVIRRKAEKKARAASPAIGRDEVVRLVAEPADRQPDPVDRRLLAELGGQWSGSLPLDRKRVRDHRYSRGHRDHATLTKVGGPPDLTGLLGTLTRRSRNSHISFVEYLAAAVQDKGGGKAPLGNQRCFFLRFSGQ